jgi:hypothetical protein
MLNVRCWRSKQTPMLECGNAGFDPKPTLESANYCIAKGCWRREGKFAVQFCRPDQPLISILPDRINSKKPIPRYRNVC